MLLGPDKLDGVRREVALPAVDGHKPPPPALFEDVDTVSVVQCWNDCLQHVVGIQHVPALLGWGSTIRDWAVSVDGLSLADLSQARCPVRSTLQRRSHALVEGVRCREKATSTVLLIGASQSRAPARVSRSHDDLTWQRRAPLLLAVEARLEQLERLDLGVFPRHRGEASRCRSMSTSGLWTASTLCWSTL